MFKKPSAGFIVIWTALSLILYWFFDLVAGTIVGDWVARHLADLFGLDGAKMIAAVSEFTMPILGGGAISYGAYLLGRHDREALRPSSLRIVYDDGSKPIAGLHGASGERYYIKLRNEGLVTLHNLSLQLLPSRLAHAVVSYKWPSRGNPILFELNDLHPNSEEEIYLFGLSYGAGSSNPDDVFNIKQTLVIEARARDTKAVKVEFEYDPDARPMVRGIRCF